MPQRADERNSLPDLLEDFLVKNLLLLPDVAECRCWRIFLPKICHSCLMPQRAVDSLPDLLEDFLVKNLSLLPNAGEPNERHDCLVIKLHPGQVLKNNQKNCVNVRW
jgi:hypothetical protein